MIGWAICGAELRIPRKSRFAAHRMVVIADPQGRAVRQFNGLASWWDDEHHCWRHKPIGYMPTDRLRGYDTRTHQRTFMPINGANPPDWNMTPAVASGAARVLADGFTREQLEHRVAPALAAIQRINGLAKGPEGGAGLPYPFLGFGPNSNSFFHTLLSVMGFALPDFAAPAILVPGARGLLLPQVQIDEIRRPPSAAPGSQPVDAGLPRP